MLVTGHEFPAESDRAARQTRSSGESRVVFAFSQSGGRLDDIYPGKEAKQRNKRNGQRVTIFCRMSYSILLVRKSARETPLNG